MIFVSQTKMHSSQILSYAALMIGCACSCPAAPTVAKVEPPNWWVQHTLNPVRLLIRGTELKSATVQAPEGIQVSNVRANEQGTYLFADLDISTSARPGRYPLQIRTPGGNVTAPFALEAPLPPQGRFAGFSPDDVIYLIMPDRFANGDPSNDDPAISRGLFDRSRSHYYHGGDLQGIIDHLPYFRSLGVTALWLTPVYDNTNKLNVRQSVKGQGIADYHGYGAVDYYAVDEHLGSLELLKKLVDQAHAAGLKVIQDQVANHVGPDHPWVKEPPKPDWFHGTAANHINETWQMWSLPDPHASPTLRRDVLDGWFANALPDLNQEDPDVAQYEIQNALWWVGMTGFDGIRQDTLPYVSRAFWRDWSAALKRQYPMMRAVGEVFDPDPAIPSFFQGGVTRPDGIDSGIDSVFDFPDYFNLRKVFAAGDSFDVLSRTLAADRLYPAPDRLVTFLGNHDVMRFISEKGATAANLKLAFTALLTMRGIPSIYYGDEIGMAGGADPDNRHDFPGGWRADKRSAFDSTGRTAEESNIFNYVQKLLEVRRASKALRRGNMVELDVTKQNWVYAREADGEVAIVAINKSSEAAAVQISFPGEGDYRGVLRAGDLLSVRGGAGTVQLPAASAEIYVNSR